MTPIFRATALCLAVCVALSFAPARAQEVLDGVYRGLGQATGQVLIIAPDPGGFRGELRTPRDGAQPVLADRRGVQAEAVVDLSGRAHLMQVTPQPNGAEVAFVPFAPDGRLLTEGAMLLTFVRDGEEMPDTPAAFVRPPSNPRSQISGNSFLNSYPFWRPSGVATGYLALPERMRTLIRLFPTVQLDIIWKLCLAPANADALAKALRAAAVDCATVTGVLDLAQRSGKIADYRDDVREARRAARTAVLCADRYRMTRDACERSAERLSSAAVSLDTPASVLARYR